MTAARRRCAVRFPHSASERREYEESPSSSCTGNEMWNEMSRYNWRAAALACRLLQTDRGRDCWGEFFLFLNCPPGSSFIISTWTSGIRGEKKNAVYVEYFSFQIVWMILCCRSIILIQSPPFRTRLLFYFIKSLYILLKHFLLSVYSHFVSPLCLISLPVPIKVLYYDKLTSPIFSNSNLSLCCQ